MGVHIYNGDGALREARLDAISRPSSSSRLLFVTWGTLGFSTYAREIAEYAAGYQGVDTIHVILGLSGVQRAWATGRVRGGGILHPDMRQRQALAVSHATALSRLLRDGGFRAAFFAPASASELIRATDPSIPFGVGLDTTAALRGGTASENRWLRRSDTDVLRKAAFVAPMSDAVAQSLEAEYRVSRGRLVMVPPAIDTERFRVRTRKASPPRLIFVGNDWARKGGPQLLEWFGRHLSDRAQLHVFGDVPKRHQAHQEAVTFHGEISRERLLGDWLPSATALLLPSRLEMTPWVVIEAAAARVPSIASAVGSLPEMIDDGETGFLLRETSMEADFLSGVSRLLNDASYAAAMGEAARLKATRDYERRVVYKRLLTRMLTNGGDEP